MEDIFKFLLVLGIIVVGLVKQSKKEVAKRGNSNSGMPDEEVSLPENWGGKLEKNTILTGNRRQAVSGKVSDSAASYRITPPASVTPSMTESDETSPFAIHSVEEARQAIIWSEILQRKY